MSKSGLTNDTAHLLQCFIRDEGDVRKDFWELAENLVHVSDLTTHMYSLQLFQAHLKQLNKGFIRYDSVEYRRRFHQEQKLDTTNFDNDTTASFARVAIATLLSVALNNQIPSVALQIVASIPDYSQYDKLTEVRRKQYLYHWYVTQGVLKDWYQYERAFFKDIEGLIKIRNGERTARSMEEQVIWDTDLIYAHWFSKNPTWSGRAPLTPLGKAVFKLE